MTIKDIARETGYSISTVSRALNNHQDVSDEAKKKIEAVVKAHKFVPNNSARQLKTQATNNIALLVKGTSNILFVSIIEKMQILIKQAGYTTVVYYLDEDADEVQQALQLYREHKVIGLAFLGGNLNVFKTDFHRISIPSVLVTNSATFLPFENLSSVSSDDRAGASCAIDYLIKQGHKNICIIGGDHEKSYTSKLRYEGCIESFLKWSVEFDRRMQYQKARFSYQDAYVAAEKLLERVPKVSAIFAMSDMMAVGAIRAIIDKGLQVPHDISVIGFDGIDLAGFYNPKITTIRQAKEQLATRSVEILLDSIENKTNAIHEIVPFRLVEGESVREVY